MSGFHWVKSAGGCQGQACPHCCPVVLSLFNGIGGAFRCYDICGVRPLVRIAFDTCKESNRVTQKRWPDTLIYLDVRDLGPKLAKEWRLKFGDIEKIHVWGGFPCVDLSSAKAYRQNLEGPGSSLFWEIPRILGPRTSNKPLQKD